MNETKQKQTHRHRELVVTGGDREAETGKWCKGLKSINYY